MPIYEDDDFGYDEEDLGYDDEVGIRMPWQKKKKSGSRKPSRAANPRMATRRAIQEKALTGEVEPTLGYRVLGLGTGNINSSATALTLAATVQEMFRVRRPIISVKYSSSWISGLVTLTAFTVGNKNQFLGNEGGPAEGFAPNAVNVNLMGNVANPGQEISMTFGYGGLAAPAQTTTVACVSAYVAGESIG